MGRSCIANGTLIGGGSLLVINLEGDVEDQCPGVASGTKARPVLAIDAGFSPARGAVRAAASGADRTGGAVTGLPGIAACKVGFTAGCGTIEAFASASGGTRTMWSATRMPLLNASSRTTVAPTVRYA
jgi:hypothetical protein